jgi:hypothetical protein
MLLNVTALRLWGFEEDFVRFVGCLRRRALAVMAPTVNKFRSA